MHSTLSFFFCRQNCATWKPPPVATCSAHTNKNYAGEMYTYDSRFLDFVGTVTVTSHFGYPSFQPVRVSLWVGAQMSPLVINGQAFELVEKL